MNTLKITDDEKRMIEELKLLFPYKGTLAYLEAIRDNPNGTIEDAVTYLQRYKSRIMYD